LGIVSFEILLVSESLETPSLGSCSFLVPVA